MKIQCPEPSDCIKNLVKRLLNLNSETDLSELHSDNTQKMFIDTEAAWETYPEILSNLSNDGKAVAMVLNSRTFEDKPSIQDTRKELIEKGLVETVILLPSKLLSDTNISMTLMIFSRNNESVMMIDAGQVYHEIGKNSNTLTDSDIEEIAEMCATQNTHSVSVKSDEIKNNNYSLSPIWYLNPQPDIENGLSLESISKSVMCGVQIPPDVINSQTSETPTSYKYLTPKNIGNSSVDTILPYFTDVKDAYLDHKIKNTSLIITGLGNKPKLGLIKVANGEVIIAVGRLYVFELDEDKVNPYDVLKYLVGEEGKAAIERCYTGNAIGALNLSLLKDVLVPTIDSPTPNE